MTHKEASVTSFHTNCKKQYGGKFDDTAKKAAIDEFKKRADVQEVIARLQSKLSNVQSIGFEHLKLLAKACSFSHALYDKYGPLCSLMTADDYELMDLFADIDDYYGDAHGASNITTKMPCAVLDDFFESLREVSVSVNNGQPIVNKPAVLRFSHAGAIKPLIAHLRLFNDEPAKMSASSLSPSAQRKWHSSRISPFAANVWFILLVKDKKLEKAIKKSEKKGKSYELDESDLYVATLVNERLVNLPECEGDDGLCKLKSFRKREEKNFGKDGCNLDSFCRKPNA